MTKLVPALKYLLREKTPVAGYIASENELPREHDGQKAANGPAGSVALPNQEKLAGARFHFSPGHFQQTGIIRRGICRDLHKRSVFTFAAAGV